MHDFVSAPLTKFVWKAAETYREFMTFGSDRSDIQSISESARPSVATPARTTPRSPRPAMPLHLPSSPSLT